MSLPTSSLDPAWTKMVISSMGPSANPRLREILGSLIQHVHLFTKDISLTTDEWQAGMKFLIETGQASTPLVNELQIVLDCLGMETLVDEITYFSKTKANGATPMAILGPFYRDDAPVKEKNSSIVVNNDDGKVAYMHGRVLDCVTKKPIKNAVVQIWQASTNGLYDQQDPKQMTGNLRGQFRSDENGEYALYCLKPTPYPIAPDSPAEKLLDLMDKHHFRPAHIHAYVVHEGFVPLITQLYAKDDPYLLDDATCAVVDPLVVEFKPRQGDPKATLDLEYDFLLAPTNT